MSVTEEKRFLNGHVATQIDGKHMTLTFTPNTLYKIASFGLGRETLTLEANPATDVSTAAWIHAYLSANFNPAYLMDRGWTLTRAT